MAKDSQNRRSVSTMTQMLEAAAARLWEKMDSDTQNEIQNVLDDAREARHGRLSDVKALQSRLMDALSTMDAVDKGIAWSAA